MVSNVLTNLEMTYARVTNFIEKRVLGAAGSTIPGGILKKFDKESGKLF